MKPLWPVKSMILSITMASVGFIGSGCATEQTSEQLGMISQQLADTAAKLDEFDGSPEARETVEGMISATEGLKKIAADAIERVAAQAETRGKVAAGLEIGGDILGGPWGSLLKAGALVLMGGGGVGLHNRTVRKQKEASHNHGTDKTMAKAIELGVKLANGNKEPSA